MQKCRGFTLLELVIVVVITGIIAASSSTLLMQGFSGYFTGRDIINASEQGSVALERMTREIRLVASSASITTATASQFSFTDVNANTISYSLSGSQLIRTYNSVSYPLADNIGGLTFTYYTSAGAVTTTIANIRYVVITLNISFTTFNYNLYATVYPWNLK